MKTQFKSNILLVGVMAAIVSLTSCTKDEITPTTGTGGSGDPNYGMVDATLYQPGHGPIIPQREAAPLPHVLKKHSGKHSNRIPLPKYQAMDR